jgi:CheY-like chemotaxis protein
MKRLNKIIFIDDDIATNDYHRLISEKADVAEETLFYMTAESALAGLTAINSKYDFPDFIFIDINMPDMNGHEFIDAVRELPNFNENRTVLAYLTTTMTNIDVAAYAANGMKHFYFKNISAVDLCRIVKEIFGIDTTKKTRQVKDHRLRKP